MLKPKELSKIILIGLGPHSKRIYYPLIEKFSESKRFKLVAIVDLESKKEDILDFLGEKANNHDLVLIPKKRQSYNKLNREVGKKLNELVKKYNVSGVIISTEPLVHVMYAKWALKNNLHILMDKPISTHFNISTNEKKAKKLIEDYDNLEKAYKQAIERNPSITFSLMAQRRFHPAFKKIRELIADCKMKTNCPVTSIQTFHCDGQWRMPSEIINQLYHPYMQGYGKCSHSGYHFFDIVPYILSAGTDDNKFYDNIEVISSFVRPLDFMAQLTLEDYEKLFGKKEFNKYNPYNQTELNIFMKKYGEIDAFTNICFKRGNRVMTVASLNLAHNGFARRDWITAEGRDLYKGNGRVRHEFHIIEQGPFQSIHYHSYQSEEINPEDSDDIYEVGGEYHLEIFVFRNTKMIGGKALEVFNIKDLNVNIMGGKSRGHQEDARANGFLEFIEAVNNQRKREEMTSEFLSHKHAVIITSAIYQSAIARLKNKNPLIKMPFEIRLKNKINLEASPLIQVNTLKVQE